MKAEGMDLVALEKAFEMYPDVKLVVYAELYGFPGNVKKIKEICEAHGALLIEDAEEGKSCPTEVLEAISSINAEGKPVWKPMHMQPMYRMHECIGRKGSMRAKTDAYIAGGITDVGVDIFQRGVCLPSDNKMTEEQQDRIIEVIRACFE